MRYFAVLLVFSAMLAACGPGKKMTRKAKGEHVELEPIVVSAKDNAWDIYRASASLLWDITHTSVALSFNWKEKTADGQAWIDLHPYFYPIDTIMLDAKSMSIETVATVTNGVNSNVKHTYKGDSLTIYLGRNYEATETLRLYIKYKAMPYAEISGGSAAITDDRGLYFINTDGAIPNKPRQIWTQGETESNSHWLPTIDKPNQRFTVKVELTIPDTMQTLGNGLKTSERTIGNGLRTDTWEIDKPIQAYAIMFAIGRFSIVKDKWRDKEVNYYVEPEYAPYASKMFNNTPEMMEFFSKITGVPYPWEKYHQVVVRDYVSGAMENTSASLYGEFMNQNFREIADRNYEDIVSHELFHQWFGDYVTMESWSNLTVSESFANYGEQLWRRYKYGQESADKLAYEDLQKYLYNRTTSPPLVRYHYADKDDMFDRISYEKGGAILNYLHALMGTDAFYKAMNVYLTENALSSTETTHWRHAVEKVTGKDWNWFFDEFYYHGGHPNLDIKYDYSDSKQELYLTVTQNSFDSGYYYQLPLKAALIYNDEKTITDWNITKRKEVFTYPYKNGVRPIIIPDVEHWLPGTIKDNKNAGQWLAQYLNANDYISKRLAIAAAVKNIDDSSSQVLIDKALNDKSGLVRTISLAMISNLKQEKWAKRWSPQVAFLAINDPYNDVKANAFDMLGAWKIESSKNEMISAINDSSYNVAGSALYALYKIDSGAAYNNARQILSGDPKASLEIGAQSIVAGKGDVSDITYFESKALYVYGSRKLAFASVLSTYLTKVKDTSIFERGLNIILQIAKNESIKSYRFYVSNYIFALGKQYKNGSSAEDKFRYSKAKLYAEDILNAETDPDNKRELKNLMKASFGEEKK